MLLDDAPEVPAPEDPPPETGTYLDEFLGIYRALSRARGWSQAEVDRMDIAVVAMELGLGGDKAERDDLAQLRELKRRRDAGEDVGWEDVL